MPLNFVDRHNGPREHQIKHMLDVIGVSSIDELIRQTIPSDILLKEPLKLDGHISEHAYLARLRKTVAKNKDFRSMIGLGFYGTASLPVITRNIFENPSWYTSYTPYQAEISQGRLEALINFQTMISSLTGFPMSNCSMLDDATAAGEAMRMIHELRSRDAVKAGKNTFFVDRNIFPQVLSVVETRAKGLGIKIELGDYRDVLEKGFSPECYGALLQYPAADGEVRDYSAFCEAAHKAGILVAAHCDILALAVMKEPAAWGADVAVGTAQRFGLGMGFGGSAQPRDSDSAWASAALQPAGWPPATSTREISPDVSSVYRWTVSANLPSAWLSRPASSTSREREPHPIYARPQP